MKSLEHVANRELDPAELQEFKEVVFSKYIPEWNGHLGHKWKHEDTVTVVMGLMARLDECPPPDADPEYCACAECYENFVYNWCMSVIDDICWGRAVYRANLKLPFDKVMKLKPRRKNCKQMEYEQHGNILYIKMNLPNSEEFRVWTIEAEWKDWVDVVWPVHLNHDYRLGWYIAKSTKRQLRDGSWFPCDVSVAHLFCSCLHGETVMAADDNMLNFTDNNLIRRDNTEKNITDPDTPPRAFQLSVDVATLDQWRPVKKVNTTHDDTADENEDGSLKGRFSAGVLAASQGLDRVVDGEDASQATAAPAPTARGIDRKVHNQSEAASMNDTAKRTAAVEILKSAQEQKAAQEGLDALWKRGTAHLSKSA